jgi:hypothetical protein
MPTLRMRYYDVADAGQERLIEADAAVLHAQRIETVLFA